MDKAMVVVSDSPAYWELRPGTPSISHQPLGGPMDDVHAAGLQYAMYYAGTELSLAVGTYNPTGAVRQCVLLQ